jgi:4-alpha-glucanotransferase
MTDSRVEQKAQELGVQTGFWSRGEWKPAPDSTLRQVVELLEASHSQHGNRSAPIAVRPGGALPFQGQAELETEAGERFVVDSYLPHDVPFGYHTMFIPGEAQPRMLICAPAHCYLPDEAKVWGWAAQLYSIRSEESWGIGDLADLRRLAEWSAGQLGARTIMINPLVAVNPGYPVEASPYFPSSRCFRNPLYLSLEALLESSELNLGAGVDQSHLERLRSRGRALNSSGLIDRDAVADIKYEALGLLWAAFRGHPSFDRFVHEQGKPLEDFATFSAISEVQNGPWRQWPESLSHPGGQGIPEIRQEHEARIRFHQWTQWLLDLQLARAGDRIQLINDLPVGVNPAGFDAWEWNDSFATGFSVGAPPDDFNMEGQNWGIAPFDPSGLKACAYEPYIRTIGAGLARTGGLRVDHVMGMFRLFWVPEGGDPSEGTYVSYPAKELLDIVALESWQAGAFVVGEDLGTVEHWMREHLAARSILSYRLLLFEPDIEAIPSFSLAAVTTHDLPTVAGLWTGADLEAQRKLHREAPEESVSRMKRSIASAAGAGEGASVADVILGIHAALARSPAAIVAATLEDALGVEERPNMPGTAKGWPNWSRALPVSLEELMRSELAIRVAEVLGRDRTAAARQESAAQA